MTGTPRKRTYALIGVVRVTAPNTHHMGRTKVDAQHPMTYYVGHTLDAQGQPGTTFVFTDRARICGRYHWAAAGRLPKNVYTNLVRLASTYDGPVTEHTIPHDPADVVQHDRWGDHLTEEAEERIRTQSRAFVMAVIATRPDLDWAWTRTPEDLPL